MRYPSIMCFISIFICCTKHKYVVSSDDESENTIEIIEMSTTDNIIDSQIQDEFDDELYFSSEEDEKLFIKDVQQLKNISNLSKMRQKATIYRIKLQNSRRKDAVIISNIKSQNTALKSEISELRLLVWLERMLNEYREDFDLYEWTEMKLPFKPNKTLINQHPSLEDKNEEYERQRWLFFLNNPPSEKIEKLKEFIANHSDVICIEDFATIVSEFHSRVLKFQKAISQCDEALIDQLEIFMFDDDKENIVLLLLMQGVSIPERIKTTVRKELESKPRLMLMSYDLFKIQ